MADRPALTELIRRAQQGDAAAAESLFATTYAELRRLARARLRAGRRNTLLDTASLVHESYLRFAGAGSLQLEDRVHFMRWAGRAMRSIIVDFARRSGAQRRGGAMPHIALTTGSTHPRRTVSGKSCACTTRSTRWPHSIRAWPRLSRCATSAA